MYLKTIFGGSLELVGRLRRFTDQLSLTEAIPVDNLKVEIGSSIKSALLVRE